MTDSAFPQRLIWSGSFLAAIAAHAALVLPWLQDDPDTLAGAGGQQLDVISVTMAAPGVLESREIDRTKPIPAAPADAVEVKEGASAPQQAEAKKDDPKRSQKKAEEEPREADAILEVRPETEKHVEEREKTAVAGGVAARGDTVATKQPSGPVAASAGAVREYARSVSQALVKTKPKGTGVPGTVKVKFTIAATGRLSSLEILKSSGNKILDQRALDAVQRAVFPPPPPGMTVVQLTYELPYQFR
jgi:protein TonB